MKVQIISALLAVAVSSCCAQYAEGPPPPRFNIPGAIPVPIRTPQALRPPPGVVRVRKPQRPQSLQLNSLPGPTARHFTGVPDGAKPVVEEIQEEEHAFVPQLLANDEPTHSAPSLPQPPQSLFTNDPQDLPPHRENTPRPTAPLQIPPSFATQKFALSPAPVRNNQPQFRNPGAVQQQAHRQREQHHNYPEEDQKPIRKQVNVRLPEPAGRAVEYQRPSNQYKQPQQERERKPVAQTIRKWRDESEDGTITWGFENDDGSFKEEVIGVDCVTRGRYGYVDPDGLKREYNYETGNLCDPNKRDQSVEEDEEAFLPAYPNAAGKVKRPQQPQQQQFYRQ